MHGGVNRNVREFYNLHADQIPTVEPSVLDRDRVRRVVLVEVTEPERLGDLAELARRDGVEVIAFDHHSDARLEHGHGARRRGRRGRHGHAAAAARARGAHHPDARDGVRARHPRGHRVADVHLDHATATSRRWPPACGSARTRSSSAATCAARSCTSSATCCASCSRRATEREVAGLRIVTAAAHAGRYVEDASALVSRVGDTVDWDALVLCVEMEGRVLVIARSRTSALSVDAGARSARRRRARAGRLGAGARLRSRTPRSSACWRRSGASPRSRCARGR